MRKKRRILPQAKDLATLPTVGTLPRPSSEENTAHPEPEPFPCTHLNGAPAQNAKEPEPRTSKHPCPCCGCYTLPAPAADAIAYICPVCFWENDVFLSRDDEPSDENHGLTLKAAQANFKQFRACDPRFLKYVRTSGQDAPTAVSPEAK